MNTPRIMSLQELRDEMKAVVRREKPAPADAKQPSFNSVDALTRLLTPDNRRLLALIRDKKPQSIANLAEMSGRQQPNLTRTLAKLEAAVFIRMTPSGHRKKTPSAIVKEVVIKIDPCTENDQFCFV